MLIKIFGSGCPNCQRLEENTKKAVEALDLQEVVIEKITDMSLIMNYGIMSTPALVIDEKVLSYGRVPDVGEIKEMLNNTPKIDTTIPIKNNSCGCGNKC
ncbi:MAG: redox-active disulfide protein 2 [Candidatus Magasanikbacteria bacterium CG10_big_fil_rev_8_21_14_0_10_36_16]|uniref:Redox-active disulfide protein 2 n=1 Tax=Candidatus Magasanikbacteria bacterium CG10_big_fil_rev_8_21_14_0_10_36_16 TaxID=1974645 RepID=A0A2H0TZL8_9BACT|nr:MAG: redox-active disulfide protein 2 [Candidatus Magasanikbacteria bacterium CG10_big_fil_rev_8_21_14_0_10_36_16]